jgi:plastocyanin
VRRALRIGAGLGLALFIVTCTDQSVTGPKHPGSATLDLSAWAAAAPGAPPVPVDSLEIVFQRATDGSVALDTTLRFRADTLKGDSAVIHLNVELSQTSETFNILVRAFGAGFDWYHFTGSVQLTAGVPAQPTLTGQYVGPGANAVAVKVLPADTTVVGGTGFPLRTVVLGPVGDTLKNVPIGYRLSDSTRATVVYPTPYTATLTAALSLRDSAWLVAETPTHRKDSTRVHLVPQPAQLVKVSGDNQTGVIGGTLRAPFVVRLLDALGAGFKGDSVRWSVTSGTATLSAPVVVSDDTGYAQVTLTPKALGPLTVQATAKAISGVIGGSPVSFAAMAGSGNVKKVVISPKIDTVAYGATVQYGATLYDSLGNVVTATVLWSSTTAAVATVDPGSGLATTVGGDSTRIIASSGGYADTARLFVRVLRSITVTPPDTVITAVGDSLQLRTAVLDNFGVPVTTGLKITFASASPGVVKVDSATGKARLVGPGNGVVLAKDSVGPGDHAQGSATLRVNQVTRGIVNSPVDSVTVGVTGQTPIIATALDSNGYAIPGKTFNWTTRSSAIATVNGSGLVIGAALGSTYAVDSLVEPVGVFKDSTRIVVTAAPPKVLQWSSDSTAVGNGGNISIGLSVTTPPVAPLTVNITSTDTTIAKASPNSVTIPTGSSATSVTVLGLRAGRAVLTATDPSGLYSPKQMTVGVVSTITFREIANPGAQQQYFYLNQNETHKAQVWLSDPAPAGGLGITFVYGRGISAVTPSPAVIPAGQLSADIVFQGLQPGPGGQPDSVVPTSGGYLGKFSYVYVAPDSLRLALPYPGNGTLGVGQVLQPYVSFQYIMDHPLFVTAGLSSPIGTTPSADTIPANITYRYFNVVAKSPGTDTLTVAAPGWVSASAALTFTTPHLHVSGTTSMVAGDPSHGSWSAYAQDSLGNGHPVVDTVRAALVSRDPTIVAVDSGMVKILPGNVSASVYSALRAQPGAGGKSVWLVPSAPGYTADSFQVSVQAPALTLALSYPYDGRVAVGTLFPNAGYVSIPYQRPDTLWVVFGHTKKSVVAGPDSVAIPKGSTYGYFNTRGDTLNGTDTMSVTRATGYLLPGPVAFRVDSIHARPYSYPSVLYTISAPQVVSAYAYDPVNSTSRVLVAPLRVALSSSNTNTFKLDSAAVTIPAGTFYSNSDTLRVTGVVDTVGAVVRSSAAGSTSDSSGLIKVLPTQLTINVAYPYTGAVGRGLKLQGNLVTIPAAAPNTVTVALQRYNPLKDSLSAASVLIPKGLTYSQPFDVIGIDSTGSDSVTASAAGFVAGRATITPSPVHIALPSVTTSHLTTEPPQTIVEFTELRASGITQNTASAVQFSVQSTDSTVIRIDSAGTVVRGDSGTSVVAAGTYSGYFRVRYVGSGTARIRVAAVGFSPDSSAPISVTGPSLNFAFTTVTTGSGQIFQYQYVSVNNAVTGSPLVVHLARSDSGSAAASQIFGLSADSVTIPVGATTSQGQPFDITGQNIGSAQLFARASGYGQATATVAIGQPLLAPSIPTLSLYVGAAPTSVGIYTEDQTGATRIVASAITIQDTSSLPGVAVGDSATLPIAARNYYNQVGVKGLQKGSAAIVFFSPGYRSGTVQVSVDTATLTLSTAPNGLGPNQTAAMAVSIPFAAPTPIVVTLGSSNTAALTVPSSVTIPVNSYSVSFNVTGVSQGNATVTATAPGFYAALPVVVTVGQPKLGVSFTSSAIVGQKSTLTVYAEDANGTSRNVTQPVTVTLASSVPGHTSFDSSTITIPVGSSYVQTGVTFDTAGVYTISASAPSYTGGSQTTTAVGALVAMVAPTTFSPANVTISAGQYVTWKNNDTVNHSSTSDSLLWDTGVLTPGQTSGAVYFGSAGTYPYHCSVHGSIMTGTVTVQ